MICETFLTLLIKHSEYVSDSYVDFCGHFTSMYLNLSLCLSSYFAFLYFCFQSLCKKFMLIYFVRVFVLCREGEKKQEKETK